MIISKSVKSLNKAIISTTSDVSDKMSDLHVSGGNFPYPSSSSLLNINLTNLSPNRAVHKRQHSPSPISAIMPKRKRQSENVLPPHFSSKQAGHAKLSTPTASVPKSPLKNVQSAGMATTSPCRTSFLPRKLRHGTADTNLSIPPLKSLPHPVVACVEHYEHEPLTRSSLLLVLNLVIAELRGASFTICKADVQVAAAWSEGCGEIRDYAGGVASWEDCAWCTVESILVGPGGLVLLTGILSLGKTGLYDQLLGALAPYRSEDHMKRFDVLIRKYVQLHKDGRA